MDSGDRTYPVAHGLIAMFSAFFAGLSPAEWAAIMAAFLNFLLIFDWFWKRFWRPLAIRRGWMKIRRRARDEEFMAPTDVGELDEKK